MGGTLGPLVQGSSLSLERRVKVSLAFAVMFLIGALSTFRVASLLGAGLGRSLLTTAGEWRVAGTAAGLVLLAALDVIAVRRDGYCPLSLRRQTPRILQRRHPMLVTAALWGLDLGTAVSTFRVASATWGALLLVAGGWVTPWAGLFYAIGFTAPLMFLMWTGRLPNRDPERAVASIMAMSARRPSAQWLSAGLLALGAILVASSALARPAPSGLGAAHAAPGAGLEAE
jgi:hypothetical protein